jgi:thymidylate kinase
MSGFDELAQSEPDRWLVIDATPPKDELEIIIRRAVCERLGV